MEWINVENELPLTEREMQYVNGSRYFSPPLYVKRGSGKRKWKAIFKPETGQFFTHTESGIDITESVKEWKYKFD